MNAPDTTATFKTRCEAQAFLVAQGEIDLRDAMDSLQAAAEGYGLVAELGQDAVQEIMAAAFNGASADAYDKEKNADISEPRVNSGFDEQAFFKACDDARAAYVEAEAKRDGDSNKSPAEVRLDDFVAYLPMHSYVFLPTREPWPAASVNARIPPVADNGEMIAASAWLDRHCRVEQMTWCPGEPTLIRDRIIAEGGWIARADCTVLNLYRPPTLKPGNATAAKPWLDHADRIYPNEAEHIIKWLAHRVQRPAHKINHALVLGGAQGIGKDTLLEPTKRAIGPWNFFEISPQHLLGRFNGFLKSVILRISEARDLGDVNRFSFYDHSKSYTAAPPDVLRVDEKNLREYSILNCCGVIITTNHKSDGLFLPADDRRHFVAWSDLTKDDFTADYWDRLWYWYGQGGDQHVAAYLAELDLSAFNAKAPPPKTRSFWDIVNANRSPEDAELADAIDRLGKSEKGDDGQTVIIRPNVITIDQVALQADAETTLWLRDRKNRRVIPHRLESCGYEPVRNDDAEDGLWKIRGKRQVVYARKSLSIRDRLVAVREFMKSVGQ